MINYKNDKTGFEIDEKEIAVSVCRLIAFLKANPKSKQAKKITASLESLEAAVALKQFKN